MAHVHYTQSAQAEVDTIAFRIALDNPRVADRFLAAVDDMLSHLARVPETGTFIEELANTDFKDLRQCTIKKFRNYIILYRILNDEVQVLHILDGRRDYLELFSTK